MTRLLWAFPLVVDRDLLKPWSNENTSHRKFFFNLRELASPLNTKHKSMEVFPPRKSIGTSGSQWTLYRRYSTNELQKPLPTAPGLGLIMYILTTLEFPKHNHDLYLFLIGLMKFPRAHHREMVHARQPIRNGVALSRRYNHLY